MNVLVAGCAVHIPCAHTHLCTWGTPHQHRTTMGWVGRNSKGHLIPHQLCMSAAELATAQKLNPAVPAPLIAEEQLECQGGDFLPNLMQ